MNATDPTFANILQTNGTLEHYHVPKYQREYTWGKNEWEQLFEDIYENDIGYFMGSIICIDDNEELGPGESRIYEVVDGQQRLTTITVFLMSIYRRLQEFKEDFNDQDDEDREDYKVLLSNIRKQLVLKKNKINSSETGYFTDKSKKKYVFLRVQPSTQNSNLDDYKQILEELKLIDGNFKSRFCGVRRLYKAYNFFYEMLPESYDDIIEIVDKLNSLKFIHITVSAASDAFVLFESLNNRGVPLSAMDIIKNKMLAQLEKQNQMDLDEAYDNWQSLLEYLPEYTDQERFLRQYYNAFKVYEEKKIEKFTRATKSNLIKIYETYINDDALGIMNDLLEKAEIYDNFIDSINSNEIEERKKIYIDLSRIGSSPSYLFLIFIYSLDKVNFEDRETTITDILQFFVNYYVRRNITDFPNTRDLDAINIDVIEKCKSHLDNGGKITTEIVKDFFLTGRGKPASINQFKDDLGNNLFYFNSGMTRFVLSKLDEISHSREYKPDLWARNEKGLLVWTIEHIFPQGDHIPETWIKMVANGDKDRAYEIHEKWVHCLGNLTLSGYNSKLSNADFIQKQSLHENKKFLGQTINIGYKNGLSLNSIEFEYNNNPETLATISEWNEKSIISRNVVMVNSILKLFAFSEDEYMEFINSESVG